MFTKDICTLIDRSRTKNDENVPGFGPSNISVLQTFTRNVEWAIIMLPIWKSISPPAYYVLSEYLSILFTPRFVGSTICYLCYIIIDDQSGECKRMI